MSNHALHGLIIGFYLSKCARSFIGKCIVLGVSEGATNQEDVDEGDNDKLPGVDGGDDESDNISDIDDFEVVMIILCILSFFVGFINLSYLVFYKIFNYV